jgi:vitamin B12 transporter
MRGLKLRALAGTTFRAPTFNDLFYPGLRHPPGTPASRSSREGRSYEIGASWESGDTRLSITAYRNKVKDLIGYEPNFDDETFEPLGLCPPGYAFGCARNDRPGPAAGREPRGSQRWGALELSGSVELLDAEDSDTGYRLNRRAAHQESVR